MTSTHYLRLVIIASILLSSTSASAEEQDDSWPCASETMAEALETARDRLVRVEDRFDVSLGIVFHSRRHVLTTFSAVFWAEAITVQLADGRESAARVVATDADNDLAILEIDHVAKKRPMKMGEPARVGDPVFAVGRTGMWGDGEPSVHAGVVNSRTSTRMSTDALKDVGTRMGGPVFDCRGRLIAIARQTYGTEAVPIGVASALAADVGVQPTWEGPAVRPHFQAGALVHGDEQSAGGGIAIGVNLVGLEGWEVKLRLGVVALGEFESERTGARIDGQTAVGYRLNLADDVALGLTGGVSANYERFCADTCDDLDPTLTSQWRFMPAAEVSLYVWPAVLSYQYMLDVEEPELSIHQVLIGVDF